MKTTYADDIDKTERQIESDVLHVMFYNEKSECFDDTIVQIKKLPYRQLLLITTLIKFCKLILVNPATTKRSFSTAKRIKYWIHLNLKCLVVTKRSHILKQTCS